MGEGKFQPREVKLGVVSADAAEVLSGLQAGEQVVTRANFLIDSESRLRASLSVMGGK
jgi:Cu(I)/Ag(I) efflux system membrane fusion protein